MLKRAADLEGPSRSGLNLDTIAPEHPVAKGGGASLVGSKLYPGRQTLLVDQFPSSRLALRRRSAARGGRRNRCDSRPSFQIGSRPCRPLDEHLEPQFGQEERVQGVASAGNTRLHTPPHRLSRVVVDEAVAAWLQEQPVDVGVQTAS